MGMPGGFELVVIVLIALLFFGGKKLPELMRGLGNGIKEFKKAQSDISDEINKVVSDEPKKDSDSK
jgi:sec-independent protein translocase protein TatA